MLSEEVISLLDHLYEQFPYAVARWVKENAELHVTLRDNTLSQKVKTEDE